MAGNQASTVNGHEKKKDYTKIIQIYQKALDDLVNVNSLFTVAVFVGLSSAPDQFSLDDREECHGSIGMSKRLIVFEIISFSCLLFSGLVAKSVKVDLHLYQEHDFENGRLKRSRVLLLFLSALASIAGCVFLEASMLHVIQLRLGKLSCRGTHTLGAAISMIVIICSVLIIYMAVLMVALSKTLAPVP
ncbi:uncharacterized protein LOC132268379 [Cornus florida]|uniref:uncharacterized protein LOC132268379 n=1 Tax=Cornus florida TaxID=4283 RepID=UPI00289C1F81|nr:uncharacterized protein LOC132268379 [Cornus florida]